jgi:DNA end-binding protein Ku
MARSIWKGTISFGLVSIPVRLYLAQESGGVSFRQLHRACHTPIKLQKRCPTDDVVLGAEDIVRGYEVGRDEYVILDDSDMAKLPLRTTHSFDIDQFVDAATIPMELQAERAYWVEPQEAGEKAYALLRTALKERGRIAIGKVALSNREHLAAIVPQDGALLMTTLFWPEEIRSNSELRIPADVEVGERELKMALALVDQLTEEFSPEQYEDKYRAAVEELVSAKLEHREVQTAPSEPAAKVTSLLDALRASIEATQRERGGDEASGDGDKARSRPRKRETIAAEATPKPRARKTA